MEGSERVWDAMGYFRKSRRFHNWYNHFALNGKEFHLKAIRI
jgi:hypothetical protein